MLKIQYISHLGRRIAKYICSTLAEPLSLDSFDINIIDLNDKYIWTNSTSSSTNNIDCGNDL